MHDFDFVSSKQISQKSKQKIIELPSIKSRFVVQFFSERGEKCIYLRNISGNFQSYHYSKKRKCVSIDRRLFVSRNIQYFKIINISTYRSIVVKIFRECLINISIFGFERRFYISRIWASSTRDRECSFGHNFCHVLYNFRRTTAAEEEPSKEIADKEERAFHSHTFAHIMLTLITSVF